MSWIDAKAQAACGQRKDAPRPCISCSRLQGSSPPPNPTLRLCNLASGMPPGQGRIGFLRDRRALRSRPPGHDRRHIVAAHALSLPSSQFIAHACRDLVGSCTRHRCQQPLELAITARHPLARSPGTSPESVSRAVERPSARTTKDEPGELASAHPLRRATSVVRWAPLP